MRQMSIIFCLSNDSKFRMAIVWKCIPGLINLKKKKKQLKSFNLNQLYDVSWYCGYT